MLQSKKEQIRFYKFALVGISGTIVDFSIFNLLISLNVPSLSANSLSFVIAVLNNFIWNRVWTYPESKANPVGTQLVKFVVVSIIGLLIRTFIFNLIEDPCINFASSLLGSNFFLSSDLVGSNVSLAIVIIIVLFWNYLANRSWTYKNL